MWTTSLRTLDLSDHRVAFLDIPAADDDALPLVLLHGGAVDRRMWGPQLGAFEERRLIVPDARGHGGSSDADGPYRFCDDVVALLDRLGIERAVLGGVSMGGGTAVDTALEHPERVAALVVSGTGTSEPQFREPWALEVFTAWQAAGERGDADGWVEAFMRFVPGPQRDRADVDGDVLDLIETMARDTLAAHVQVGPDGRPVPPVPPTPVTQTWERLGQIQAPVLAICGALDGGDHRDMGRRLADAVPDGRYVEVPGSGHYPNLENPDFFNAEVGRFLAELE
ncbi:alpha/beta fold hydrolase [Aeromicrobium phragmitis]|uniref:Alpha/beta fold hydrolase n=1 Tax=Aeromicrobium phragmitis TaxID=2478914 RepID=A0A3L8PKB1_9ACTN|nr:alpha/beta hydrolase [Aeromicrobium phragmitis]RLV55815.1 alpha/beta fold hydrolase [Aeromicrobium phragmitis]